MRKIKLYESRGYPENVGHYILFDVQKYEDIMAKIEFTSDIGYQVSISKEDNPNLPFYLITNFNPLDHGTLKEIYTWEIKHETDTREEMLFYVQTKKYNL